MSMRTRTTFPLTQYSSDRVCMCDSSEELRFLGSPYVHTHHTYIHATCKRHVEKVLTDIRTCLQMESLQI